MAARLDSSPEYLARKELLLDAAAQVFHRKGYSRTRLAEIASIAGIDRANVYYYVANKRELFLQVLQRYLVFESKAQLEVATSEAPAADRLRRLMIDLMNRYDEHYPYAYLASLENYSFLASDEETAEIAEQINALAQRQFQAIRMVVKDGVKSGEFTSSLSLGVLTEGVVGLVAWSSQWFNPGQSRYTGAEIGAAFADLLLNGLLGGPPARTRAR
jgi:TetR/AcrR family transcriptional regulator, cholesterol catabolism regulator